MIKPREKVGPYMLCEQLKKDIFTWNTKEQIAAGEDLRVCVHSLYVCRSFGFFDTIKNILLQVFE